MKRLIVLPFFWGIILQITAQPGKKMEQLYANLNKPRDTSYAKNLLDIGVVHRNLNQFDSADYYFNSAKTLSEKIGYKLGICASTYCLGDVYSIKSNYDSAQKTTLDGKALELYLQALDKTADLGGLRDVTRAKIYKRIAGVYLALDDADRALGYLKDAEQYVLQADTMSILDLYKDLVYCYGSRDDTVSAFNYFRKGAALCDKMEKDHPGDQYLKVMITAQRIHLVSNVMTDEKNASINDQVLAMLEKLWDEKEIIRDDLSKSIVLSNLSSLYMLKGEFNKSIDYANLALTKYPESDFFKQSLYMALAKSYYATGNFKQAYEYHALYHDQYESRYKEEKYKTIAELQTKYESEKKEQQIIALNGERKSQRIITAISIGAFVIALGLLVFALRANRLQKKLFAKEKELQKKEMEKKMFELEQTALRAQMNPHFIFNSLNSVQRFVINNDAEGVSQYLSTFANLIRQTLENSGKQLIPLKDELRYLETYLRLEQMRGNDNFKYLINVNPDIDTDETYIPNMIIQPYLENSVIHGMAGKKPNEGIINLMISKNHKLTCVVDDNGAGIAYSKTHRKTIDDGHESMGTAITEKRIEMFNTLNNEKIELEVLDKSTLSNSESGTRIMIKFPLTTDAN